MTSSAASETDVSVADHPEKSRFEAFLDGQRMGQANYRLTNTTITFTHTEVDDEAEGKGVGSTLAQAVLDSARERGLRVVPQCQFIAHYISRHPDYLDLVDEDARYLVEAQSD
jgi:predicted GNAT family acetyltransferase